MTYTLEWLETFDGEIDILNVDMSCLANTIEKYVSQYKYVYQTNMEDYPEIVLSVPNSSIPHLLGLSRDHHANLPTNNAGSIFEGLKDDWTLERLNKADNGWFNENKFKIVGTLLLYQMLHVMECKFYTTDGILNRKVGKRFRRDNIYFVVFKLSNGISYTVELSREQGNQYFPRSLKINDTLITNCREIELKLVDKKRFKTAKARKVNWPS
ncbi:hypothetical protein EFM81_04195 [Streptococcus thermophilus]|uniref:hypothetical protein n=1 Tax=Streptococcus TaxID=1301 RepID=UPI00208F4DDD|nr:MULTISPECIES: hypothetical protein [Streptococcus]MCO4484946.1 hypothetical protein [Streptococcus infantarius subsp. infantarius]MCO4541650.1 hypothetical protein [Streptococcus infantarius subsp. infantarius]MCT2961787.1 hypothetical protein [Streptococcus thermophilus]